VLYTPVALVGGAALAGALRSAGACCFDIVNFSQAGSKKEEFDHIYRYFSWNSDQIFVE
jgi:hypothetical protein